MVRHVELDHRVVCMVDPDAHRTIPVPRHVPAVVPGLVVLNQSVLHPANDDPVSAVVFQDGGVARVVLCQALANVDVF